MRTLPLTMLLAMGCQPDSELQRADAMTQANGGASTVSDPDFPDHLVEDVQILKTTSNTCPTENGWVIEPLFPNAPGRLRRYCVATNTGTGAPLNGNSAPEAVVVAPMTFPTDANRTAHTASETAPIDVLPPRTGPRARLAILDALGEGPLDDAYFATTPAWSDHGQQMGLIARGLTRDATDHAVELYGYSALQYRFDANADEPARVPGGSGAVGSQSDLARAVYDAVSDYVLDRQTAPQLRLVINISAGWHASWGGDGSPALFDPNIAAVYEALQYASCEGVLVVAAAGNLGGLDTDVAAPLYPAGWERFAAPSPTVCNNRYGVTPPSGSSSRRRLVHAVGGVRRLDAPTPTFTPIGMSRPGSLPSLTAAGAHVATENDVTGQVQQVSGTSAATAVVAASAALVRAYRPDLTAHETVDVLKAGAVAQGWSGGSTVFCPDSASACQTAQVVTACHSLVRACASSSSCTTTSATCTEDPTFVPHVATAGVRDDTIAFDTPVSGCAGTFAASNSPFPPNDSSACPMDQLDGGGTRPLTLPTPMGHACEPYCELFLQDPPKLVLAMGNNAVDDLSLATKTQSGKKMTLAFGKVDPNDTITLAESSGLLLDTSDPVLTATLTYTLDGASTVWSEEILIVQ